MDLRPLLEPTMPTKAAEWVPAVPALQGTRPLPRAHAASILRGSKWYVVGGAVEGGLQPVPSREIWVHDLASLEKTGIESWTLLDSEGPSLVGGAVAYDALNSEIVLFGGSTASAGLVGTELGRAAVNTVHRFSLLEQRWVPPSPAGTTAGRPGCGYPSVLHANTSVNVVDRCPLQLTQQNCEDAGDCGSQVAEADCLNTAARVCAWSGGQCVAGCVWSDAVEPAPRTYLSAAPGQVLVDAAGMSHILFFGGATYPTAESVSLCGNVSCTGDPDVWSLPLSEKRTKIASDAMPLLQLCRSPDASVPWYSTLCRHKWESQGTCESTTSDDGMTPCVWYSGTSTFTPEACTGKCGALRGSMSTTVSNGMVVFDSVTLDAIRDGVCQGVSSANDTTCAKQSEPDCTGLCTWVPAHKVQKMLAGLSATLQCPTGVIAPSCMPAPVSLGERVCSRCRLMLQSKQTLFAIAGSNFTSDSQQVNRYVISDLEVAVVSHDFKKLASDADVANSQVRIRVQKHSPAGITMKTEPLVVTTAPDAATLASGEKVPGAAVGLQEWVVDTAPSVVWIVAEDTSGTCQASVPVSVTVVPGSACHTAVSQRGHVTAGDLFSVSATLSDTYGNIAYCDAQQETWRLLDDSTHLLKTATSPTADGCLALCEREPDCMMWNFVDHDTTVTEYEGAPEALLPGRTCRLYNGIGRISGAQPIFGATSGVVGMLPCPAASLLTLKAVAAGSSLGRPLPPAGSLGSYPATKGGLQPNLISKRIGSHMVLFPRLRHTVAESLAFLVDQNLGPDCPGIMSPVLRVLQGEAHAMKAYEAPAVVHASLCSADPAFKVVAGVVDKWGNLVTRGSLRVTYRLEQGSSVLQEKTGVSEKWTEGGFVSYTFDYAKAENISLQVIGITGDSIGDIVPTGSRPASALVKDMTQLWVNVRVRVLSGRASQLALVTPPPSTVRSYGGGQCEGFSYVVELQDVCGNPVNRLQGGKYYEAVTNHELRVTAHSGNPDIYSVVTPQFPFNNGRTVDDFYSVLSAAVLVDGRAELYSTHSRADTALTLTVSMLDRSSSITSVTTPPIAVTHCTAVALKVLEPHICQLPDFPEQAVDAITYEIPTLRVGVVDYDGNLHTSPVVRYTSIWCYADTQGTAFANHVGSVSSLLECATLCDGQHGATFFGMRSGSECVCDNGEHSVFPRVDPVVCQSVCPDGTTGGCGSATAVMAYAIQSRVAEVRVHAEGLVGQSISAATDGIAELSGLRWSQGTACQGACPSQLVLDINDALADTTLDATSCSLMIATENMQTCTFEATQLSAPLDVRLGYEFGVHINTGSQSATGVTMYDLIGGLSPSSMSTVQKTTPLKTGGSSFRFAFSPGDEGEMAIPGLKIETAISGASETRLLVFETDTSSPCSLEVRLHPASVASISRTQLPECVSAGSKFDITLTAQDKWGNTVVRDSPVCVVAQTHCDPSKRVYPRSAEDTMLLTQLVEVNSRLKLGAVVHNKTLVLHNQFWLSDLLDFDAFGIGKGKVRAQPSSFNLSSFPDTLRTGVTCIALQRMEEYDPERSQLRAVEELVIVDCSSVDPFACVSQDAICAGGVVLPSSQAVAHLAGDAQGATLRGVTSVSTAGGVARLVGLSIDKAGLAYTLSTALYSLTGRVDGTPASIRVAPGTPSVFTTELRARELISGLMCISCDPHDSFSVVLTAYDAYGNLAWTGCEDSRDDAQVFRLSVGHGSGMLVSSTGQPVVPVAGLAGGVAVFSGLRYTRAERVSLSVTGVTHRTITIPQVEATFEACLPTKLRTVKAPTHLIAGHAGLFELVLHDAYGNTLTADPLWLVDVVPVVTASPAFEGFYTVSPLATGEPGRIAFNLTVTKAAPSVHMVVEMTVWRGAEADLSCAVPSLSADLVLEVESNEPVSAALDTYAEKVLADSPMFVRASLYDRFGNLASSSSHGQLSCRLELESAVATLGGTSVSYRNIEGPSDDMIARVSTVVQGTTSTFDEPSFRTAFAYVAGVSVDSVRVVDVSDANSIVVITEVLENGATRYAEQFIARSSAALAACSNSARASDDECCYGQGVDAVCFGGALCQSSNFPSLCLTTDASLVAIEGSPQDQNSSLTSSASRHLMQLSPAAEEYFTDNTEEIGLAHRLLDYDLETGLYPKRAFFVPSALLGTQTTLTSREGLTPYQPGRVLFKDTFVRLTDGTFTLRATCSRINEQQVGSHDVSAPQSVSASSGNVAVVRKSIALLAAPPANACRRAGQASVFTFHLIDEIGDPVTAPSGVHLSIALVGRNHFSGPVVCDAPVALLDGAVQANCTLNTDTAVQQSGLVSSRETDGRPWVNRASRWTNVQTITEVYVQQASGDAAYASGRVPVDVPFVPACVVRIMPSGMSPREAAVNQPFDLAVQAADTWGNVGGSWTLRLVALNQHPSQDPAAVAVDSASLRRGGSTTDVLMADGVATFSSISVTEAFLLDIMGNNSRNEPFVWFVAYIVPASGRDCDTDFSCDPHSQASVACTGSTLHPVYGCVYHVFEPILVTPAEPYQCEFTEYPSIWAAGAENRFSVAVRVTDRWGIPVHKVPSAQTAKLFIAEGTSSLRLGHPDVPYNDAGSVTSFLTPGTGVYDIEAATPVTLEGRLEAELWVYISSVPYNERKMVVLLQHGDTFCRVSLEHRSQKLGQRIWTGLVAVVELAANSKAPVSIAAFDVTELPAAWGLWEFTVVSTSGGLEATLRIEGTELQKAHSCATPDCTDASDPAMLAAISKVQLGSGLAIFLASAGRSRDPASSHRVVIRSAQGSEGSTKPPILSDGWQAGGVELVSETPFTAPDALDTPVHIPTQCGFDPRVSAASYPQGCIANSLQVGVQWEHVWYDTASKRGIRLGVRLPLGVSCVTPAIEVVASPADHLVCRGVPSHVTFGEVWDATVAGADFNDNHPSCFIGVEPGCTTGVVAAIEAGRDGDTLGGVTRSTFDSAYTAEFQIRVDEPRDPPLPGGTASTVSGTLGSGFGLDMKDLANAGREGWDTATANGTWVSTSDSFGSYFSAAGSPSLGELSMKYLTNGRSNGTVCSSKTCTAMQNPTVDNCCRDYTPGRVRGGHKYDLKFSVRRVAQALVSDTGSVVMLYMVGSKELSRIVFSTAGVPNDGRWHSVSLPHTAPIGATDAAIELKCTFALSTATQDRDCNINFDAVDLVHVEAVVYLRFMTTLKSPGTTKDITSVTCPPVRVTHAVAASAVSSTSQSFCAAAVVCGGHGYCSKPWACPTELAELFPSHCCESAVDSCLSGKAVANATDIFKRECGDSFCSGKDGMVRQPTPCDVCFADTRRGFWAGPNCQQCAEGYTGSTCADKQCPADPLTGKICGGHGVCRSDGKCICYGSTPDASTTGVALQLPNSYLEINTTTLSFDQAADTVYTSCSAVLEDFLSGKKQWPLLDDGVYTLEKQNSTQQDEYLCRFLSDSNLNLHGMARVGVVWTGAAGFSHQWRDYDPLTNLDSTGSVMFEYPGVDKERPLLKSEVPYMTSFSHATPNMKQELRGGPWLPHLHVDASWTYDGYVASQAVVARQWSTLLQVSLGKLLRVNGTQDGAVAKYPPGAWDYVVLHAEASNLWVMFSLSELHAATKALLSLKDYGDYGTKKTIPVLAKSNSTIDDTVCVYIWPREYHRFSKIGIYASCEDTLDATNFPSAPRAWKMWLGESGDGEQASVADVVGVYAVDKSTGVTSNSFVGGWTGQTTNEAPTQYFHHTVDFLVALDNSKNLAHERVPMGSSKTGYTLKGGGGLLFNLDDLPVVRSLAVDIRTVKLVLHSTVAAPLPATAGLLLEDGTRFPAGRVILSNTTTRHELEFVTKGLTAAELKLLVVALYFESPDAMTFYGATLSVGYSYVREMEAMDFSAMMKLPGTQSKTTTDIFSAGSTQGESVSIVLSAGALVVSLQDTSGAEVTGTTGPLDVVFSDEWVRLKVEVDLLAGTVHAYLGQSIAQDKQPTFSEVKVDMKVTGPRHGATTQKQRGKLSMRQLLWMDKGMSLGTAAFPINGYLREVEIAMGGVTGRTVVFQDAIDSTQSSVNYKNLLHSSAQWVTSTIPPKNTSYDGAPFITVSSDLGFWAGDTCSQCATGYHGGLCSLSDCSLQSAPQCSGHGTCTTTGVRTGECQCQDGYDGFDCSICADHPTVQVSVSGSVVTCSPRGVCPPSATELAANPGAYSANGLFGVTCAIGGEYFLPEARQPNVDCTVGSVLKCIAPELIRYDTCGCPTSNAHKCAAGEDPATVCCSTAASVQSTAVPQYNCMGYSNLYVSCPKTAYCGRQPATMECLPDTEGQRQFSLFCSLAAADACVGSQALPLESLLASPPALLSSESAIMRFFGECDGVCRAAVSNTLTSGKCGACAVVPETQKRWIDCEDSVYAVHAPKQEITEDFCGCTSPMVLPVCNPSTTRQWTGTGTLRCLSTCPDWAALYKKAGFSVDGAGFVWINCATWPKPQWVTQPCAQEGFDPCGCAYPQFRCTDKTEGACDACPAWGAPVELDCKGSYPPALNRVGNHKCGCHWPPAPVCVSGTSGRDHVKCPGDPGFEPQNATLVDCLGQPRYFSPWRIGMDRFATTRACKLCSEDVYEMKQCMQGTQCPVLSDCPAGSTRAIDQICPSVTVSPVQCNGMKLQPGDATNRPACYCETTQQYRCEDCTSCCHGRAFDCAPYACGESRFTRTTPGSTCRTSCTADEHCVAGHVCVSRQCVVAGTTPPPLGGCLRDPSVCEPYGCDLVSGLCKTQCWGNQDCYGGQVQETTQAGYRCTLAVSEASTTTDTCQATETEGECVWTESIPLECFAHDDCAPYACGKNHRQTSFSHSRCRSSCAVDAHCSLNARCNAGVCQLSSVSGTDATTSQVTEGGCYEKDYDFCTPYACGKHIALAASPLSMCRTSCITDGHCQLLHTCMQGRCVPGVVVQQGHQAEGQVSSACYPYADRTYSPTLCLRVPLASGGDLESRWAYVPPPTPPVGVPPMSGVACTSHSACRPYACGLQSHVPDKSIASGSQCQVTCDSNSDCQGLCHHGECVDLFALGTACSKNVECISGHCVHGMCCNSDCRHACQTCSNMGVCEWERVGHDEQDLCGRCSVCIADPANPAKRVCGAVLSGLDAKKDCSGHGRCDGNRQCQCSASPARGFWSGATCHVCSDGYTGDACTVSQTLYIPPEEKNATSATSSSEPQQMEKRAVQYPTRVLDYSTQATPANVQTLVGPPDATATYYSSQRFNRDAAWEPLQYYCDREVQRGACPSSSENNAGWRDALQYVTLEYAEAVYLSQVHVYENYNPGSVVAIYAQPAPSGTEASPGGGAPLDPVLVDGVLTTPPRTLYPARVPDQALELVNSSYATEASTSLTADASGSAITASTAAFTKIWSRDEPRYFDSPLSRVYAPNTADNSFGQPTTLVSYNPNDADVSVRWKTKVIRVVLNLSDSRASQIDTVGIVGFSTTQLDAAAMCPGYRVISETIDGTKVDRPVQCSGHGSCGPYGCECVGNWGGSDCSSCRYGYTGELCDVQLVQDMDRIDLCRLVMFEDLVQYEGSVLERRWSIQDYVFLTTRVYSGRHYGTRFVSPEITLDTHTHIRVEAGVFVVDVPHHSDSGIIIRGSKTGLDPTRQRTTAERALAGERVLFTKHIPYLTGVNIAGAGLGDTSESIDVIVPWEPVSLVLDFEIWSNDLDLGGRGDHRFTLTHLIVHSCSYPSQSGTESPDKDLFV
eukprot:TRINITY_DN21031_c0_g1_i4.p1 TRINITY_DN21031_c0_g1~~TRINITY_DN21031_c0_g1_i4.p1  ORF type:complete len:6634 (+),score=1713.76 TRINITY_DN21031_c0_g1_i4:2802-19904(+)